MADIQQVPLVVPAARQQVHTCSDACLDAVNPATVPQRSPFRYPGGKTWFVPFARMWLQAMKGKETELVEPFAGGAITGLTAAFEGLVSKVILVEVDPDVSAVWRTILYGDGRTLADKYASFSLDSESIKAALRAGGEGSLSDRAFSTLLRNRISRGGIIAPGAGVLRNGENGKGLSSRWYPDTIRRRILDIIGIRDQITFMEGDGISAMEALGPESNAVWFIDPPYTVAGKRLYTHSSIDHEYLFQVAGRLAGDFVLTYDESDEVKALAARSGFETRRIRMKNTHHIQKYELVIGRSLNWLDP